MNQRRCQFEKLLSAALLIGMSAIGVLMSPIATAEALLHPSVGLGAHAPLDVVFVRGKVYLIMVGGASGSNIAAQVGDDGILLVNTGPPAIGDELVQAIREHFGNKPVRFIINTSADSDHTGGNAAVVREFGREQTGVPADAQADDESGVRVVSSFNAQQRMAGSLLKEDQIPREGRPVSAFVTDTSKEIYFNDEGVLILAARNKHVHGGISAHTDSDIMVFFRRSDVVATGDSYVMGNYPVIDIERGGSLDGLISSAISIERLAISDYDGYGGITVIPGHGELSSEAEVIDSLFMLTIIRDRVAEMIRKGMTFEQVRAARPTLDYDAAYGGKNPFWTPDMFLSAVYRDLTSAAAGSRGGTGAK